MFTALQILPPAFWTACKLNRAVTGHMQCIGHHGASAKPGTSLTHVLMQVKQMLATCICNLTCEVCSVGAPS